MVVLPAELSDSLKNLSRHEGATLFMTLLAAFQTLLMRYTGSTDIAVGIPAANRSRPEIEGVIGFFVNMLVIRTSLRGDPSFRELIRRVREPAVGAYTHQDMPFDKLVEQLRPNRSLNFPPFFQVTFTMLPRPLKHSDARGLRWESVDVGTRTAKFDLTLSVQDSESGLVCVFGYGTQLFDASTIKRMAGHWEQLLNAMAQNPDRPVRDIPILPRNEWRQLASWNQTAREYPREKCVHTLFEEQAERTPEALAVTFENEHVTLRRVEPACQSAGALSAKSGRGSRGRGGNLHGAVGRDDRGAVGDSEGGWGLSSLGRGIPCGPASIHDAEVGHSSTGDPGEGCIAASGNPGETRSYGHRWPGHTV